MSGGTKPSVQAGRECGYKTDQPGQRGHSVMDKHSRFAKSAS